MDFVSMTCRHCGGKLKFNKDADQILCQFCGTEYVVSFTDGSVSLKLLSERIEKIVKSTDKTASELALVRIRKEKAELITQFGNIADSLSTPDGQSIIFIEMGSLRSGKTEFAPTIFRENCADLISRESSSFFKNKKYLQDLKKIYSELVNIENKETELEKLEKYHLDVVNNS